MPKMTPIERIKLLALRSALMYCSEQLRTRWTFDEHELEAGNALADTLDKRSVSILARIHRSKLVI